MIESILLILLLGMFGNKLFSKLKLPGLLGMIFVGIIIGPYGLNLLHKSILDNSSDIRNIALIVILLRAGLGLDKALLKKVGKVSIKMSAIPCLVEGITILFIAHTLLHISIYEAGMLGFIIAAVSPAVVVPYMLSLKEKGIGMKKGVPIIILAGSSIDDIFAITIFTVFMGMFSNSSQPIWKELIGIPIQVLGGIILGLIFGVLLSKLFTVFKEKLLKLEKLSILLSMAFLIFLLGKYLNISGLLGVMTMGFFILEKAPQDAVILEKGLNNIWFFAQSFLFVLIGAAVNIHVALGAGFVGVVIIFTGLIGRTLGVFIALFKSNLNLKEKMFCAIAYVPKATVQAAIGAIPLSRGVPSGEIILAIAVMAIIITAPIGAMGIKFSAPKLLN